MRGLCLLLSLVMAGCPAPGIYAVQTSEITCERAMRVAYRTMVQLRYRIVDLEEATPTSKGYIVGAKRNPDGSESRGTVRVECGEEGVRLQPVEDGLIPSGYEFSRAFGYSFTTLATRPEEEVPSEERGLQVLLERLGDARARLELGGEVLADEAVLVRLTVRNNTDLTVGVDAARVRLVATNGDPVRPLGGDAVLAVLAPTAAAERVRADLLGRVEVPADETVVRYLVFPPWEYGGDAQLAIEDVATGETDGFLVPLQ